MKNDNVLANISESSQVKDLLVTINGIGLRPQNIIDIQINFSELSKGRLSLLDIYNISEFAPLTNAIMNISYKDSADILYTGTFIVTEVNTMRLKSNDINIIIKFEDVAVNVLRSTYISKAYSNMTMLKMLEDIFTTRGLPGIFIHDKNDFVYEHFVFPANISLLEFIEKHKNYSNFRTYQDRAGLTLVSRNLLEFANLPSTVEPIFTLNYNPNNPFWNILEYDAKTSQKTVLTAAKGLMNRVDYSSIQFNPEDVSIERAYSTQQINKGMGMGSITLPSLIKTSGNKQIDSLFHNEIIGDVSDYRDIINNNHTVTIAVQGLNVSRLYTKIQLFLPRPKYVQTQEGDETFGVQGVVTEVIDKIIGGIYMQFLTIQTSDFKAGAEDVWK